MAIIWFIFIIFPCHCAVFMYKIHDSSETTLQISTKFHIDPSVEMWLIVYSNDHTPLTVRPIYSSKLRTVQMMIFSLVAMIGLDKCCITSACLQWLCHSGERIVARGPLVHISAQNIDWGYSLEPPRRGGSNKYPQSMFWAEIWKIMYTPVTQFYYIKVGFKRVKIILACFLS